MRSGGCHCRGMFHRAVLADEGLLLAFHKSFQALSLQSWLADLPVPVSFFVGPLLAGVFALCFTVNHRGKPGPLPRVLFGRFHGLSWCFAVSPGDKQGWSLAFCLGCVTRPMALPSPSFCSRDFFLFLGRVCGAVPAQIEICQCPLLSFLTPTGVALFCFNFFFFLQQPAYGLLEARRQAEPKLLAQAALFAHAWRW